MHELPIGQIRIVGVNKGAFIVIFGVMASLCSFLLPTGCCWRFVLSTQAMRAVLWRFLVAFCKHPGRYQSTVTQSVSCLGAGLLLTMLMTGLLQDWVALLLYLQKVEWIISWSLWWLVDRTCNPAFS